MTMTPRKKPQHPRGFDPRRPEGHRAPHLPHTGTSIVVSGHREEAIELCTLGVEAEFVLGYVRHDEEGRRLIDQTVKRFGDLDVGINSAGREGKPGPNGKVR
jgi:hypothetical protein